MAEKNFFNVRVFQYFKMSAQATAEYQTTKKVSSRSCTKIMKEHTHTVCVPYYKAAPYNISHT